MKAHAGRKKDIIDWEGKRLVAREDHDVQEGSTAPSGSNAHPKNMIRDWGTYCISCYFREGFIFANFASQTLAKISTSIHVYL